MNFSSFIGFNRNQKTSFEKGGRKQERISQHFIRIKIYINRNPSNIQHNFLPPPFYAVNESLFLCLTDIFDSMKRKKKSLQ